MQINIKTITQEQAWVLRHGVMWPDRELDYIKLEDDDTGIHLGLFKDSLLISVVSLFLNQHSCQFRKFATLQAEQGNGYGTKLLVHAIREAKVRGSKKIWCNARENKTHFYKRFGLEETNERFVKGGRSYVIMEKLL